MTATFNPHHLYCLLEGMSAKAFDMEYRAVQHRPGLTIHNIHFHPDDSGERATMQLATNESVNWPTLAAIVAHCQDICEGLDCYLRYTPRYVIVQNDAEEFLSGEAYHDGTKESRMVAALLAMNEVMVISKPSG